MLTVYPDYYPAFRCLAGACRHSCCIGWEIDIDDDTLAKYRALPGELGARLAANISRDEPPHFVLSAGERCPFLNKDNLCDLILAGGEDMLCQICDDHPRFYNLLPGRREVGLGLCCEGAAGLILDRKEPVRLIETGEPEEKDPDCHALLALRAQAFAIAQNRELPLSARMDRLLRLCGGCEPGHPALWADLFLELERLSDAWTPMLQNLEQAGPELPLPEDDAPAWEQLLVYCLYRYLPMAWEDGDVGSKAGFAVLTVRLLQALKGLYPELPLTELARMWSCEIEYSTENVDRLMEELWV